jgi:hypothetical protein
LKHFLHQALQVPEKSLYEEPASELRRSAAWSKVGRLVIQTFFYILCKRASFARAQSCEPNEMSEEPGTGESASTVNG